MLANSKYPIIGEHLTNYFPTLTEPEGSQEPAHLNPNLSQMIPAHISCPTFKIRIRWPSHQRPVFQQSLVIAIQLNYLCTYSTRQTPIIKQE